MLDGKYKVSGARDLIVRKDGKWYWQIKDGNQFESLCKDVFWQDEFANGRLSRITEEVMEDGEYKLDWAEYTAVRNDGNWFWRYENGKLINSSLKDCFFEKRLKQGHMTKISNKDDYFVCPSTGTKLPEKAIIGDPVVIPVQEEEIYKSSVGDGSYANNGAKQFFWDYASTVGAEKPETTVKEEVMKKETAVSVAKFCGNLALRGLNYWVATPAINIARPVLSSVRYVVFLTTIVGLVYGYNHPDVVKKAVKSCIPKVTIESPEIMR